MPKYSFIVPVYNTSKYLSKCLDSILNQSYDNYEIIIVNDGSTDNSQEIIDSYIDKRIKVIKQTNLGLSVARNNGILVATGEYIIFIDSDDYLNSQLLERLNRVKTEQDIIRYQVCTVDDEYKTIANYPEKEFFNLNGREAFEKIIEYHFVEPACFYVIKTAYFKKNKYMFAPGKYHEDFGLMPRVIIEASRVSAISYIGYNYVIRENSITSVTNYKREYKKVFDTLGYFKYLLDTDVNNKNYQSYIANSIILKAKSLRKNDFKKYNDELKKLHVFDYILDDTMIRKLKKLMMRFNLKLYLRLLK